jgi:hypothetical protein
MASFKLSNILDLNQKEKKVLSEIKSIMQQECDDLNLDIDMI